MNRRYEWLAGQSGYEADVLVPQFLFTCSQRDRKDSEDCRGEHNLITKGDWGQDDNVGGSLIQECTCWATSRVTEVTRDLGFIYYKTT
jgi:hypothetical protein